MFATGFKKPDIGFFKDDLFPDSYEVRLGLRMLHALNTNQRVQIAPESLFAELLHGGLVHLND